VSYINSTMSMYTERLTQFICITPLFDASLCIHPLPYMTYLLMRGMLYFILYLPINQYYSSCNHLRSSFIIYALTLIQYLLCLLLALKLSAFDKFLSDSSWGKKGNIVLVQCCEKRYANLSVTSSDKWYLYARIYRFFLSNFLDFLIIPFILFIFLFYSGSRPGKYRTYRCLYLIYLHIY
jgi:hypothetical protein